MKRSNFYFEQEVTQAEMDQAFDDVADEFAARVVEPGTWGVLVGLEVEQQTVPDLTVHVNEGQGYDENGLRIVHDASGGSDIDLTSYVPATPGDDVYVRIYAEHDTVESDPRVDGAAVPLNYRIADSYALSVVAGTPGAAPLPMSAKPAHPSGKVCLATILLSQGMTQITTSEISLDWTTQYPTTTIDRHEGGVVRHGRWTDRPIVFQRSPHVGTVIDLAHNDIVAGDEIRGRRTCAEGPPDSTHGFQYRDRDDGALQEATKYIHYSADNMRPQNTSIQDDPWQQAAPLDDNWYKDDIFSGVTDPPDYETRWRYKLVNGGFPGTPLYSNGLMLPLAPISGAQLSAIRVYIEVLAGGMPANVWIGCSIQRRSSSGVTQINDTAVNWYNQGSVGNWSFEQLVDVATYPSMSNGYVYEGVIIIKSEASALPNMRVVSARATFKITEASWKYQ